ncbi:hypothetical protein K1719_007989 [Acacia pycnantha]|nr:hypothetical protein K1719_007989 [Acacia pycnantha]
MIRLLKLQGHKYSIFLFQAKPVKQSFKMTYSNNLKELKAAGIQVKRSDSNCHIHITFSAGWLSGELRIPTIHVDLTTPSTYLNLMAYEVCPDFDNNFETTSYVQFLTSMVKYPDDVKELRSCGCMINFFN